MKKSLILIITLILLISFLIILFILKPIMILNGNKIVEVEVNTKYKELGVQVITPFKNKEKIKITNNIDINKVGKYEVKYKYNNKTLKRIVKVKDTEKPIIELNGLEILNVCSIDKYIEPGYKAIDNYDGDITDKVEITKTENKIIYTIKDSNNNITIKTREIKINDVQEPTININNTTIYQGSEYIDNTEIKDNCDEELDIKIEGKVDTSKIGKYTIKYTVTDKHGNTNKAEKTINIIERPLNEKIIYLTFDDGPSNSITPQLLDILKEENVKATFFVVNHGEGLDYLIKREYDEGHSVALHTNSHNYATIYSSEDAYFNDLNAIGNKVENIIGYRPKIIRFPGGSSNTISRFNPGIMSRLSVLTLNKGYEYIDWNVDCDDAGGALNSFNVYNNVINNLNDKNNVVLMHDFESNYKTLNAIRDIIKKAKELGYVFKPIDETSPMIRHRINN